MSLVRTLAGLAVVSVLVGSPAPGLPTLGDRSAAGDLAPEPAAPPPRPHTVPGQSDGPTSVRGSWDWPLEPRPRVTARFVAPRSTWGAGHRGLDVVARQGQQVRSVDDGVVTHVGVVAGRGTVSVTHAGGLRSTYEPVTGTATTGATVLRGQVLGTVAGRTHCGGSCLHLGALRGTAYVDPRPLLGSGPVVLLPLGPGP